MTSIPEKMVALHHALDAGAIPHAFGGALALAWCTQRARGTIDIDLNVFVGTDRTQDLLAALPPSVPWTSDDADRLQRDGQRRLWWDTTPIDVFLNTTDFHEGVAARARSEPFEGEQLPFLSCGDLAVFKAFFDRTRDWADLEDMRDARTLDADRVVGVLARYLGPEDHRVRRLLELG
jgi:hypothetical protein